MQSNQPKKTLGKRKIPIQKIEKRTNLQVTFTKRRSGLFKKASELSILCGAQVAILVQSPAQKVFSFGYPAVDSVVDRFENRANNFNVQKPKLFDDQMLTSGQGSTMLMDRIKYEEAVRKHDSEKKSLKLTEGEQQVDGTWFEREVNGLELSDLEEYLEALEGLRDNAERRLKEKEREKENEKTAEVVNGNSRCGDGGSSLALVPIQGEDEGFDRVLSSLIEIDDMLDAAEFSFSDKFEVDLDFKN